MSILVAFRHGDKRLFSRVVTFFRGGDTAHCESALQHWFGSLSLCVSSSFIDGGVRGKVIDLTDPHKWRVYLWQREHADLMDWLQLHYRSGYDIRALVASTLPRVGHSQAKKHCAESVAEHLLLPEAWRYDPAGLEAYVKGLAPRAVWSGTRWHAAES